MVELAMGNCFEFGARRSEKPLRKDLEFSAGRPACFKSKLTPAFRPCKMAFENSAAPLGVQRPDHVVFGVHKNLLSWDYRTSTGWSKNLLEPGKLSNFLGISGFLIPNPPKLGSPLRSIRSEGWSTLLRCMKAPWEASSSESGRVSLLVHRK